jgi:osmotically-inducible protein OsmY
MPTESVVARIEKQLEEAGLHAAVEQEGNVITLSGEVQSTGDREAAEEIAASVAPDKRIDNNLEVEMILPETAGHLTSDEPSLSDLPDTVADIEDMGAEIDPDLTDQNLLTDPHAAVGSPTGAPGESASDPVQEGDEVYFPPTDPVITIDRHGQAEVLGGFSPDSMDEIEVAPSASDGLPGDEALADAIRRELREDSATTDLQVDVLVRNGIARLRGRVPTLEDAENAEDVAGRVPGIEEVREELEVVGL